MIRKALLSLWFSVLILIPCLAQDSSAPDPEVQKQFQNLKDATRPTEYRLQTVNRLLREGRPEAIPGLRALLLAEDGAAELKLLIITGALYYDSGLALLDAALAATLRAKDEGFRDQVRTKVAWARSPGLVTALVARATARAQDEALRLLAIDLLGAAAAKEAVDPLISLWEAGQTPYAEAGRKALFEVLPLRFLSPAAAREFWRGNSAKDMETILREGLRLSQSGEGNGADRQLLIKLAKSVVEDASLASLLDQYLGCRELGELRRMGAERLGSFPYARFAGGEAEGRKLAAAGLLAALAAETVPEVEVALLRAARTLAAELREAGNDRIRDLCLARLKSQNAEVRLAAVQAAGELRDHAALVALTAWYDQLSDQEQALRLAVLQAVDLSGNGNASWVHEKLKGGGAEDITIRLIQILRKYQDRPDSEPMTFIPTLIEILKDPLQSARVRQETATAIGEIGVLAGNKEAIDALALFGLADEDESVRDIAATRLGRAPEVDGVVVEMLRARLGEVEKGGRVRLSAARSLLNLRRAKAVSYLRSHLADDAFWRETVRSYLARTLLGGGDAAGAADLVRELCQEGLDARCAEAARLVIEHKDLKWEAAPQGAREATAFFLARSLEITGKDAEALRILSESVPETFPFDPKGLERALLHARLLRKTGAPGQVAAALEKIAKEENLPEGTPARIAMETALALMSLGRAADAVKVLRPYTADITHGKQVQEILAQAEGAAAAVPVAPVPGRPEDLIPALDEPDPVKRAAAVAALKQLGARAHPALLAWIGTKKPADIPAAMVILTEITGVSVPFDPAAPEAERQQALAELKAKLGN